MYEYEDLAYESYEDEDPYKQLAMTIVGQAYDDVHQMWLDYYTYGEEPVPEVPKAVHKRIIKALEKGKPIQPIYNNYVASLFKRIRHHVNLARDAEAFLLGKQYKGWYEMMTTLDGTYLAKQAKLKAEKPSLSRWKVRQMKMKEKAINDQRR